MLQLGGMKEGDFIVSIGDKDVKWASHDQVVRLIKQCGDSISLKLVTPMDRNYLKVKIAYIILSLNRTLIFEKQFAKVFL